MHAFLIALAILLGLFVLGLFGAAKFLSNPDNYR